MSGRDIDVAPDPGVRPGAPDTCVMLSQVKLSQLRGQARASRWNSKIQICAAHRLHT
jgi:hypothetical protein